MKRQQPAWQTVPSKKGEKVAETIGTKTSNEVKSSTEEKSVPTGTISPLVTPTGENSTESSNRPKAHTKTFYYSSS